jgi:hypothetical protein
VYLTGTVSATLACSDHYAVAANDAVETILGISGDEFSLLSAEDKLDVAQQHRSGGRYLATVCCERPTGDFNKGQPVLYCSRLTRVRPSN